MMRSTHTYVTLEVSQETYDEVRRLLLAADYQHVFHDGLIDMHGIALERSETHGKVLPRILQNQTDAEKPPAGGNER